MSWCQLSFKVLTWSITVCRYITQLPWLHGASCRKTCISLEPKNNSNNNDKNKKQQKNINIYHQERLGTVQSCALKVLDGPWCLTFALWWLGNLSIFMKIICQTPCILQFVSNRIPLLFCKAQPWTVLTNITKFQKQAQGHIVFIALFDGLVARESFAYFQTLLGRKSTEENYWCQQLSKCEWQ